MKIEIVSKKVNINEFSKVYDLLKTHIENKVIYDIGDIDKSEEKSYKKIYNK